MKNAPALRLVLATVVLITGCGGGEAAAPPEAGTTEEAAPAAAPDEDHEHAEDPLGTITLGEHAVELKQGHGAVTAGKECHLVVKLPYSDGGSTVVRAWLGTEDRTLSYVGKGEYAPSHDDYDVHATAPDPLPEDVRWWVEIELPDGNKEVGSVVPLFG